MKCAKSVILIFIKLKYNVNDDCDRYKKIDVFPLVIRHLKILLQIRVMANVKN